MLHPKIPVKPHHHPKSPNPFHPHEIFPEKSLLSYPLPFAILKSWATFAQPATHRRPALFLNLST